jgi:hypothetical protein
MDFFMESLKKKFNACNAFVRSVAVLPAWSWHQYHYYVFYSHINGFKKLNEIK